MFEREGCPLVFFLPTSGKPSVQNTAKSVPAFQQICSTNRSLSLCVLEKDMWLEDVFEIMKTQRPIVRTHRNRRRRANILTELPSLKEPYDKTSLVSVMNNSELQLRGQKKCRG